MIRSATFVFLTLTLARTLVADAQETPCPTSLEPTDRALPQYPMTPVRRELEGWVVVEFKVLEDGSTQDPVVVESSSRIFEKSALHAILKSKYPRQPTPCMHRERIDYAVE